MGVCTVACDLQGKQKLHLEIQKLINARSLECIVINYVFLFPMNKQFICRWSHFRKLYYAEVIHNTITKICMIQKCAKTDYDVMSAHLIIFQYGFEADFM